MIRGETFSIPHSQERSAWAEVNETAKIKVQVIDFIVCHRCRKWLWIPFIASGWISDSLITGTNFYCL